MKDKITEERVKKLHASMQGRVKDFIKAIEDLGLTPRISSGLRTVEEQNELYALGRTKKGSIVTNAKGGESWHNYGLAIDLCFLGDDGSVDFFVPDRVGDMAKQFKLEWGAKWAFVDRPHFQLEGLPNYPKSWTNDKLARHTQKYMSSEATVSPWAMLPVEKAKKKGVITNWSSPQEAVTDETLQWVLLRLKAIDKVTTEAITRERFAVALDRLGLLD